MLMGVSTTRVRRDVWTTTTDISISVDALYGDHLHEACEATHKALNGQ